MARTHGRFGVVWLDDAAGTCRNLSGDINNVTFNRTKSPGETTTFGDNSMQREVDGLRDGSWDVSSIFNTNGSATAVVGILDDLYVSSFMSRLKYLPAGSVSGSPIYEACVALTSYNMAQPVDGIVTVNWSVALAAGSITGACAV